ncbi:MAG: DNA recombination protein RmuC, partial [Minisyncoccales bacterium]
MDTITLLLFIAVIAALAAQTWILLRKKRGEELPKNDAAMAMLQQQLNQVSQTLDTKLAESNRAMQEQFGQSFAVIKDVTQKLTELDSTNKQVVGFAQQLQSLENILKNPKQRGILGEYYLETVLKNVLPPSSFQMQYKFKNGEIVDAAVFVKDKIIPIDSKFSLENYNRIVNE